MPETSVKIFDKSILIRGGVDLKFSILIPTYNGEDVLPETLRSILSQGFVDFEIIIHDNASSDRTEEIVRSFNDPRIKFYRNEKNLGYARNLERARGRVTGKIIYLMGQDDILGKNALLNTYNAFKISDDIGAVTRPYYWFDKNIEVPVRVKEQLNPDTDEIVRITDDPEKIIMVFRTLDQLSGLAYRVQYIDIPFHEDCFTSHVYPFASIFKKHPVVFLKDYEVAVRIRSSHSRTVSSIYEKSPMQGWAELFENVFYENGLEGLREYLIKNFVAKNYIGLIQIRNYAKYRYLWREIYYLLKYRRQNLVKVPFWVFSLGCIVAPPSLLVPVVDWYKNNLNARLLKSQNIKFEYELE